MTWIYVPLAMVVLVSGLTVMLPLGQKPQLRARLLHPRLLRRGPFRRVRHQVATLHRAPAYPPARSGGRRGTASAGRARCRRSAGRTPHRSCRSSVEASGVGDVRRPDRPLTLHSAIGPSLARGLHHPLEPVRARGVLGGRSSAERLPHAGSVTGAAGPPDDPYSQAAARSSVLFNPCHAKASEGDSVHPGH